MAEVLIRIVDTGSQDILEYMRSDYKLKLIMDARVEQTREKCAIASLMVMINAEV